MKRKIGKLQKDILISGAIYMVSQRNFEQLYQHLCLNLSYQCIYKFSGLGILQNYLKNCSNIRLFSHLMATHVHLYFIIICIWVFVHPCANDST